MFINLVHLAATQSGNDAFTYVVFASIPLLAGSAGFLIHYYATRRVESLNSADALMIELCAAHQLKSREQRLLSNIAERAGVSHPATMLVIPEVFDAAVQSAAAKQPLRRSQTARLEQLRNRLFEENV